MPSIEILDKPEKDDKFRNNIKYSRTLPEMFSTEDINAVSENITFGILGELRDRYKEGKTVTFTYAELAELGGLWLNRSGRKRELYSGKRLQTVMYDLNEALKNFSYYQIRETNSDGSPKSWKTINIFSVIDFDGDKKEVKLTISDAEISPTQIDSKGNIINKPLLVKDLINSDDWRNVKHLQYSRNINNTLPSKYSKRIYRYISEFRSFPKGTKMKIELFDKKILKIYKTAEDTFGRGKTFDSRGNRKKYLDLAVKEISQLKTPEGEQIVKDLDYIYHKVGRTIHSIEFTFQTFKSDLAGSKILTEEDFDELHDDDEHVEDTQEESSDSIQEDAASFTDSTGTSEQPKPRKANKESVSNKDEAERVIDYLNYLWKIDFIKTSSGFLRHVANHIPVEFNPKNKEMVKPIITLLNNGTPIEEIYQVVEMKAIEWKLLIPNMNSNLKPSVLFGKRYSEYSAFVTLFREQNKTYFVQEDNDFYIPMDGPWN